MKIKSVLYLSLIWFASYNHSFSNDFYSNLTRRSIHNPYYIVLDVKFSDSCFTYVIPSLTLYSAFKLADEDSIATYSIEMKTKTSQWDSIIVNKLRKNATLMFNFPASKFIHSYKYEYDKKSRYKELTDSIAEFGKEYFLDYFFETEEFSGSPFYSGKFKYEHLKGLKYKESNQFLLSVIYQLYHFKLYAYIQSYSGNLCYCLEPLPDPTNRVREFKYNKN